MDHRPLQVWTMPTKAAIFKARTRLGSAVMIDLFDTCATPVESTPGGPGFYRGWRLVSVDGTVLDIQDTIANERTYGRPGTNTETKSAYPQARLLGLVECGTQAVLGAVVSGCDTAEQTMYPGLLHKLEPDMLVIADRGFFSYATFKDSLDTGADLLRQMKGNVVLPVHRELADGSYLSAVFEGAKQRRNNIEPIPVRVIEYTVTTGKDTGEFRLITSILDPGAAPAGELAEAYAQRWEIESCFDELKTHQCGAAVVLRSKTPDGALQEIYGYLCVHNALRSLIGVLAHELDEDPLRVSFMRNLRATRRSLAARPAFSP